MWANVTHDFTLEVQMSGLDLSGYQVSSIFYVEKGNKLHGDGDQPAQAGTDTPSCGRNSNQGTMKTATGYINLVTNYRLQWLGLGFVECEHVLLSAVVTNGFLFINGPH